MTEFRFPPFKLPETAEVETRPQAQRGTIVIPASEPKWRSQDERVAQHSGLPERRKRALPASELEWHPESSPDNAHTRAVPVSDLEWRPERDRTASDSAGGPDEEQEEVEPEDDPATRRILAELVCHPRVQAMALRVRRTLDNLMIPAPWTTGLDPNAFDLLEKGFPSPSLDFNRFHRLLVAGMANFAPGEAYAFVLTKKGQMFSSAAKFSARGPVASDAPPLGMTIDQPVNIASVSKMITCGAVLKALEALAFTDLDDAIWPFFPRHWAVHSSFAGISFRDCLQFRIGQISQSNGGQSTTIAAFRSWYETGARSGTALNAAQFGLPAPFETYNNVCHGWFRLALFYMTAPGQLVKDVEDLAEVFVPPIFTATAQDALIDWFASRWYIDWVRNALLKPIGVQWADMNPVSGYDPRPLQEKLGARTLYYPSPVPVPPVAGVVPGDWTLTGGGGGWIISVRDLARYVAHLHFGGLVSASSRDLIFNYDDPAGAFSLGQIVDQFGTHFRRGGAVTAGGAGYRSRFFDFSGGLAQLTFVSNHNMPSNALDSSVIMPAFAGAWS